MVPGLQLLGLVIQTSPQLGLSVVLPAPYLVTLLRHGAAHPGVKEPRLQTLGLGLADATLGSSGGVRHRQ